MGMWGMLLGVPIAVYIYRKISKPREESVPARQKQARTIPYARRCTKCRASRYRKPVSAPAAPAPLQGGGILKMLSKLKKH